MDVSQRIDEESAVLTLRGRLDAFGAQELENILLPLLAEHTNVVLVLDMAGLNYLSSAGIRVLLNAYKTLHAAGQSLHLAGLHKYCEQVLAMTGFTGRIPS